MSNNGSGVVGGLAFMALLVGLAYVFLIAIVVIAAAYIIAIGLIIAFVVWYFSKIVDATRPGDRVTLLCMPLIAAAVYFVNQEYFYSWWWSTGMSVKNSTAEGAVSAAWVLGYWFGVTMAFVAPWLTNVVIEERRGLLARIGVGLLWASVGFAIVLGYFTNEVLN